jgi:competence protein ComEC
MFFSTPQRNQHFEISFLSVGQGDAVLMEIPGGNRLLYDAGPPGGGVLRALEAKLGPFVRTLDVVVLSHPDMDHIGGFPALCERYHIDLVIVSGAEATHGADDASSECIKKKGIQQLVAKRGMQIELGGEVVGDILFPDRDASKMETNSASIVLRVTQGSSTALFSGDLPSSLEEYLVALGAPSLDVDLIKLGHHGSRTSTDMSWLHATTPSLAVYSAGKDNTYGHPHEEVLDRLESLRIPYLGTDQEGTVTLRSNLEGFTRVPP